MDDALATWLRLREPADTAARSAELTHTISGALAGTTTVHVLDLGTGTGANLRYLAARLPSPQRWLVVDQSASLLSRLPTLISSWGTDRGYEVRMEATGCTIRGAGLDCHVETRRQDLGALKTAELFTGRHLVTASALLDLASEPWLRGLAASCRTVGAAVLFAITYNGSSCCTPVEPEDDMIREVLNRHQQTDKGLGGPAAGPGAAECAARCFAEAGYRVRSAPSDWVLDPAEHHLQRRLIEGWAEAAIDMARGDTPTIESWLTRRLAHVDAKRSRLVVGHLDVAAWLPVG